MSNLFVYRVEFLSKQNLIPLNSPFVLPLPTIGFIIYLAIFNCFYSRGDHFLFGSVFIKKSNQTEIVFEKKTKPGQTDRFRFSSIQFFRKKPVQTGLAHFSRFGSVFSVWLGFSGLARFFSVSIWFGLVFLVFCL